MVSWILEGCRRPPGGCPAKGSARRHQRDIGLAGLDNDLAKPCCRGDNCIEDRAELWSIGILSCYQLIGRCQEEVRVAEALHHEQGLRIAGHTLRSQPGTQLLLIREFRRRDTLVPGLQILT